MEPQNAESLASLASTEVPTPQETRPAGVMAGLLHIPA